MMRSLYSGVAGLKTHQTKMDVIGNNIANVNTTSFKSQSITFSDLMYQTTQTASGATETKGGVNARQIGLGAKSGAINTAITSQGATQTTNNPFDIMITGNAFFIVNNGTENLYTRDGSFYVDGAGNLAMQSNGYLVQGWVAQEDRETGAITINKNGGLSSLQIMSAANSTYSPASTTASLFSGNIDDNDTNILSDDGKTITLEFYDNKGYLYTGKFILKNTATDHLYALSLSDVLDSTGKSLGSGILDNITFGDTESATRTKDIAADSKYTFITDATGEHVTINAEGGDVKYENVPQSGNLADILSTSKKSYKGLLKSAYGVTDGDEAAYADKINATYEINPTTGAITIAYTQNDVANGAYATANYAFSSTSDKYFVDPATRSSYLIPDSSGNAGDLNEDYLTTVFGISNAATYVSSDYTYTYASGNLAIQRKLNLVATSAERQSYQASALVTANEKDYFTDADGNTLQSKIDAWKAEDPTNNTEDKLFYKYNGTTKVLTMLSEGLETKDTTTNYAVNTSDSSDPNYISQTSYDCLYNIITGEHPGTANLNLALLAEVNGMDDAAFAPYEELLNNNGLTAQDIRDTADQIATWVNQQMDTISTDEIGGYTGDRSDISFFLGSVSGTPAFIIDYPTKQYTQNPVAWDTTFKLKNEAEGSLQAPYEIPTTSPSYVYKSTEANKYAKAYSLTSNAGMFTEDSNVYKEILTNVFSTNADVQNLLNNIEGYDYKISFSGDGLVSISHNVTEDPKNTTEEYTAADNGDGTTNYTSLRAFGDVPVKGNIADLLEAAKTDTAGLLKKVYGITDAAADAYGTDGTYEIISSSGSDNGSIKLTIGDHTVQLAFNAANGALVTADGEKNGLVTMKFNQEYPGLEAFGFQASSDPDEQDKAGNMTIDFATLTNYNTNGSSTIKAVKGDKRSLNTGRAVGEMNGVSVSTDGQIYATYSNGQTKLLGQIASAQFANASGLSKEGDNLYTSTLNSGDPTVQDITTDGGYMNTGVLEMSNVDLSAQFTEMITTQRGFQANSRIITVSDTLLEELTNLKR